MSAICLSRSHERCETRRQQALKELSLHLGEALGAAVTRQAWTLEFEGEGFSFKCAALSAMQQLTTLAAVRD